MQGEYNTRNIVVVQPFIFSGRWFFPNECISGQTAAGDKLYTAWPSGPSTIDI